MPRTTLRIAGVLTLAAGGLAAWALLRPPGPEPPVPAAPVDPPTETVTGFAGGPVAEPRTTTPAPTTPVAEPAGESGPDEPAVRRAPGPAPWARGLDLPPPEVPDVAPVPDPAHLRYREDAENVPVQTQLAYLEGSLRMIDSTVGALEDELAERDDPGSPGAHALTTRIARMRRARAARVEEMAALQARAEGEEADDSAAREGH